MNYPSNLTSSDLYWLDVIQQCRTSGKSDNQWLLEHNIKASTFYYHVKRLREKACTIPERTGAPQAEVQEVVPLCFVNEPISDINFDTASGNGIAIRLQLGSIHIEITNCASQNIIQTTLSVLQNLC